MAEPKQYVRGNVKKKEFEGGGYLINFSFNIYDFLSQGVGGKIEDYADENGWVNMTLGEKKEGIDKYGNFASLWLNTFKPNAAYSPKAEATNSPVDKGELPF